MEQCSTLNFTEGWTQEEEGHCCQEAAMATVPLVKRSGRTSIVVFMLATIMVLGFCVITAFGVIDMVHDFSTGNNIGAHSLCQQ
eukprot:1139460-Pelagomonas_calceolata.AAC.3